jgi:hypothetical protein
MAGSKTPVLGRRVSEAWALAHLRSVIYGGGGRWYLKPTSIYNRRSK